MAARDNRPLYYAGRSLQPWDVVDTLPADQAIGFYRGNVIKYAMRAGVKPSEHPLDEYRKLAHYAQKLLEAAEQASATKTEQASATKTEPPSMDAWNAFTKNG